MEKQVILIAGGLTGIGREAAIAAARQGHDAVVSGRSSETGEALVGDLRAAGAEAEFIRADVRHDDEVLPNLPGTLDFSRFTYDVFVGEGSQVVALINIGITGTARMIKISEHWTVEDGKARSIWVACFEPQDLLDKLGIAHGLKAH